MTVYKSCEDFTAIYEYTLLNFGVAQADKYTEHLESTFQLLLSSPLIGI
jgi:toxin ParE1/3/4